MQINKHIRLYNIEDTENLASHILPYLDPSRKIILFLKGDLGSGKTTFSQILLKNLGITHRVKSPTYALIEPYATKQRQMYHLDLYRLQNEHEIEEMGLLDYLNETALFLVEWPELLEKLGIQADLTLQFYLTEEDHELKREVLIQNNSLFS
jgi:tRNA threonylcarbamoyladenosine biosynthesis protein TsaE